MTASLERIPFWQSQRNDRWSMAVERQVCPDMKLFTLKMTCLTSAMFISFNPAFIPPLFILDKLLYFNSFA